MSDPIIQSFLEEADEGLFQLEEDLLKLEQDPTNRETINRIFRVAHTLKGNSSMLGFDDIARFTHALEDLLDILRRGERIVTSETVDVLLASRDVLKGLIGVHRGGSPISADLTEGVLRTIRRMIENIGAVPSPVVVVDPKASAPAPAPAEAVEEPFFEIFDAAAPAAASTPSAGPTPSRDETARDLQPQSAAPVRASEPVPVVATTTETNAAKSTPSAPETVPTGGSIAAKTAAAAAAPSGGAKGDAASIRVPVDRVDRLINLVGELVITHSIITQSMARNAESRESTLLNAVAQMDRHARELHEQVMAIRMVPIRMLFGRFPRLVRDISASTGKQVFLETSGEETELDKTVIEKIADPLTHLIRNAVDHGIEDVEGRRAAGKSDTAKVNLKAFQRGGNVYIEVVDDGRGLDLARIRQKAIDTGIIPANATLTDDQTTALIFRPGFSTAKAVTALSGRGVGMDVVKRNVESLGGTISIRTERGKGTAFQIKLPLTLAITEGQLVRLRGETFVVPMMSIVESISPSENSLFRPSGLGTIVAVRDQNLPVLPLGDLLGSAAAEASDGHGILVIVESEGVVAALLVDELLGQQQVVVKNLETNFKKTRGVSGATILGDGKVALILDVAGLIEMAREPEAVAC